MDFENVKSDVALERGSAFLCTIFDCVACEHGPSFFAMNMGLLWRNVDGFFRQANNVNRSDFVVCLHGVFSLRSPVPLDAFDKPYFFSADRVPLSEENVILMVEGAK